MSFLFALALAATATGCTATDGDTIKCGKEAIRLSGIDAPELPGHCRKGRDCAPGDPVASQANLQANLQALITKRRLAIERIGTDRYGRTIAIVRARGVNLSCSQLRGRFAVYKAEWDKGRRVGKECPL